LNFLLLISRRSLTKRRSRPFRSALGEGKGAKNLYLNKRGGRCRNRFRKSLRVEPARKLTDLFSFDQTSITVDASPRSRILNEAKLFLFIEDFLRRGGIVPKRYQPKEQGKTMSSHQLDGARALDCFWEGEQYFLQQ
jgi:hypothetical protein